MNEATLEKVVRAAELALRTAGNPDDKIKIMFNGEAVELNAAEFRRALDNFERRSFDA